MPINYDYDKDKNIVYSYPSGLISMSDITEYDLTIRVVRSQEDAEKEVNELRN